jgi:hypothetical protein
LLEQQDTLDLSAVIQEAARLMSRCLRDLLGPLPFRPVALAPDWLSFNDGAAVKVAQAIYAEHAFEQLPILADALEDAGCADEEVLGHCRAAGEHFRGCWLVDLVLGKSGRATPTGARP